MSARKKTSNTQITADLNLTVSEQLKQQIQNGEHPHDEQSKYIAYKVKNLSKKHKVTIDAALNMFIKNQFELQQSDVRCRQKEDYLKKIKKQRKQKSKRKTIYNSSIKLPAGLITHKDWTKTK